MKTYIPATFLLLAGLFWQMSGGEDFEPQVTAAQAREELGVNIPDIGTLAAALAAPEGRGTGAATDAGTAAVVQAAYQPEAPSSAEAVAEAEAAAPAEEQLTAPAEAEATEAAPLPLVEIAGSRVNMREGPSTGYPVLATLDGGTQMRVLDSESGWVRVEVVGSGATGWMAERLTAPLEG
ncbi:SH3 domain-containing protein [Pseudoroseicyclus aestuarii]|uniref:SH3 domain-containing protein n=1 Tax=Pseudoroseicyclus aestuarii TaxID=1795041 RepID=A0A318STW3_9RHOB|nr:SH3 domain-containing protein [Pseudoroseicyclus aestuarii]PYE85093.1 SH3 domain-containing protein [Pseudoroseicyclus aestuarii]